MIVNIKTMRSLNLLEVKLKKRIDSDLLTLKDIELRREQIKNEDSSQLRLDI